MRISDWSSDVCSSDLRYDDKPFLRYVDAWVLNTIGALDEPTRAYCAAMEPQLRQSLGKTGSWDEIVAPQMNFPTELPKPIRHNWADGRAKTQDERRVGEGRGSQGKFRWRPTDKNTQTKRTTG